MGIKETYFELKREWVQSKGTARQNVQRKLDAFLDSITEGQKAELFEAIDEDIENIHELIADTAKLRERISIRKSLEDVLPFISISEFARTYFNKSVSWLHQRVGGYEVHGKIVSFTDEELKILSNALKDVSKKLADAAIKVAS
jgi:hypothetical protein